MKTIGLLISCFAAASAPASVCDSLVCTACVATTLPPASGWLLGIGALLFGVIGFTVFKTRRRGMLPLLTLFAALANTSNAADTKTENTGTPVKATIAELLAKPEAYAGKDVVVIARLADFCTDDGCLTLKDKFDVIEGHPPARGFKKTPKTGATLAVTGTVKVKGEGERKSVSLAVTSFEEVKK
ncbi:MAG: hypothetical protein JNK23_12655 [Opitutaceae bacterium]|nr:hypothetical protein [Opitutaceae bacterium]